MSPSTIIDLYGGDTRLADALGFSRQSGPQRVHNWRTRGIPARVLVDRPDLFGERALKRLALKASDATKPDTELSAI